MVAAELRREDLARQVRPVRLAQAKVGRLTALAGQWLQRPVVVGALAAAVVVLGPARLYRAVRWGSRLAVAQPLIARLIPMLLSARARASRAQDPGS